MKDDAHQQNEEHEQNGRLHDQETKLSGASFELSFRRLCGQASGNIAEGSVPTRGHNQRCSRAADYGSAQKDFVLVACVSRYCLEVNGIFLDGERLSSQRGLLYVQIPSHK